MSSVCITFNTVSSHVRLCLCVSEEPIASLRRGNWLRNNASQWHPADVLRDSIRVRLLPVPSVLCRFTVSDPALVTAIFGTSRKPPSDRVLDSALPCSSAKLLVTWLWMCDLSSSCPNVTSRGTCTAKTEMVTSTFCTTVFTHRMKRYP